LHTSIHRGVRRGRGEKKENNLRGFCGESMNGEIKVLQIDDDEIDVRLVKRALAKSTKSAKFVVESASCLANGLNLLKTRQYDVLLLDLGLPDSNGIETVKSVSKVNANIPIVVLTGLENEETGLEAIKNGASDYLVKGPAIEISLVRTALYAIERKKVAEKLHESQQMLQLVMNSIPQAIFWKDRNLVYLGCNAVFAKHAGLSSPQEIVGKTNQDLPWRKEETEFYSQCDRRVIESNSAEYHISEPQLQADGKQAWLDTNKVPLHDSEGNVVGVLGTYEDITERKEADRKIKEAMDLKSQFISTVSHELRTPLTIIKEDIALIMDGAAGRLKSKQREILEIAQRNIDRLARLINDVLDFQKLQSGKAKFNMQDNNISSVIEHVYNTMAGAVKQKGIELRLAVDNNLPKVIFDNDKMIQVLTNLVSNAMKFTDKGSITIASRRIENYIRVSVIDTGCGMKQEDLPKLFQQFQQLGSGNRKTGGTGLGLAISKDIVEKHGGRIWVESEFGKGTIIHFLLPIKASTCESEPTQQLQQTQN
jgi:PAS domain S-box-containing protein